jgi:hypothetical protein
MKVRFELRGKTALLQHQDDVLASDRLDAWRKDSTNRGVSKAGDDRSPAWTWQTYLYHDGKHVSIPSQNLMVTLRAAGAQMLLKKQKTFKELTQSGMGIFSEDLEFRCGEANEQVPIAPIIKLMDLPFDKQANAVRDMGFRLFVKRARVGQSKHIRVRPRFDLWTASGVVVTTKQELTFENVAKLFELAGSVGLCDWRPGCKTPGPYGMFSAELDLME